MTLSAVLLAGGESQRMGTDKATVVFRGQPLWQRQLETLHDLRPDKIFVSARTEPSWLPREMELLLDEPPSRGPLSGLTKALQQMQTSHVVALAIDMPFMTSKQLRLFQCLATKGCGALAMIGNRAESLASIYPKEACDDFSEALKGDMFSLQLLSGRLVESRKLRVVRISTEKIELYRSVNEPKDLPSD